MNDTDWPDAQSGSAVVDSVVRRPRVALPVVGAVLLATFAAGVYWSTTSDRASQSAAIEPVTSDSVAVEPSLSPPANLSAHLESGELPALPGGNQIDGFERALTTVVLRRGHLSMIDLQTGNRQSLPSPGSIDGRSLAVLDEAVVVVADSHALAIPFDGEAPDVLGQGDHVLDSALADTVWIGRAATRNDGTPIVTWTEVSSSGAVGRIAEREQPMEFDQPDFVWGFNSSLYRLEQRDVHPWRLIAHGFPVAVGDNDVVINICTADRSCDRVWYNLQSGERLDALGPTAADAIPWRYGGRISPAGQFIMLAESDAASDVEGAATQIWSVADNALLSTECRGGDLAWSPADSHVACRSDHGLIVVETATGDWTVADEADHDDLDNFVLLSAP